ncbi:dTDP-4-dehydrorhamnose 3,5-epimerase family protein [Streptomyces sp. NPDC021622]|uniref:dTDP-4-dehydrorhamnose 3,5-epimerase family protein n=1 Tax=Streptomyces sp. NPDC021622 TaxID=3155013 RepID=UPI0034098CDE
MATRSLEIREQDLPDVYVVTPRAFPDNRGVFHESFRKDYLEEAIGRPFVIEQSNLSVSHKGVLRGIHGVVGPMSQAKLVSCARGSAIDIVVDLRVGSPTFGRHQAFHLEQNSATSLFISEGLGHSFLALEEGTVMNYHCSKPYVADAVYTVHALDPALALPWGLTGDPVMSGTDLAAPTAEEAAAKGILPAYEYCLGLYGRGAAPANGPATSANDSERKPG